MKRQVPQDLPMGWLRSRLMFPVSWLILVWVAGSGSVKVLNAPTCFSDYIITSTCEWKMDGPTNCSTDLRLFYQLNFEGFENHTCVPENRESTVCMCPMLIAEPVIADVYQLDLWAGRQQLWSDSFKPSSHVKPRAPGNLTIHPTSQTWVLTWSNPYPAENYLHQELTYLVNVSNEHDPADFRIYNVTYMEPTLRLVASTLKSGASYSARVRAWAQIYNSTWSEWSPSTNWTNYYRPWEQRLSLGISITCVIILAVCPVCYISIIKIKKEWWDQIPNPAHSALVAIVIQDSQVPLWGKQSRGQEPAKCLHWKTCLTKLLPCLLEHGIEKDEDSSKAAKNGPFQGPGKPAWHPVEVSKMVLWPEDVSVVRCVEIFEAQVENEEEEVEEDNESFCPSPENSGSSFQEGREGIAARLTERLFLDILEGENGGFCPQGLWGLCLPPPSGSTQMPWAEFPSEEPQEALSPGKEQTFNPESNPLTTLTQSPASLAFTETPSVIADNPAYRRFSDFLSQSSGSGELDSDPQLAECLEEADSSVLSAVQPSEPPTAPRPQLETWEQILRQSVLQHRAAPAPASAPTSAYRELVHMVGPRGLQDSGVAGFGSSGEAGYKAFSSLITNSVICPGTSGIEASNGEGGYRPFQSLTPGCPAASAPVPGPLFTFGLDMEPPHSPQNSLFPSSNPEHFGLEPVVKGEDSQKALLCPEPATEPLRDDLGSGIVYSALTCHLCGHLKQCHGQEEHGEAILASGCCGCCCGDRSSPPVSPLRALDPLPGGVPLGASLPPAPLELLGTSEEGKSPLFFPPDPSNTQSLSHTPKMVMFSTGPTGTSTS
ncbi:interleukin-4 receptor subunit alpha isoform X1 [Manis pentadactyla]|uniref:interleukin-4 receptor subunit alpha isoform X1 n=2 Tax=Manis pentadactyla TaxID=143292 RepID=UPI00255D050A|nr:interleukin-4 receptor subunit alpha isoform X1 [Manis pentadactyla]